MGLSVSLLYFRYKFILSAAEGHNYAFGNYSEQGLCFYMAGWDNYSNAKNIEAIDKLLHHYQLVKFFGYQVFICQVLKFFSRYGFNCFYRFIEIRFIKPI